MLIAYCFKPAKIRYNFDNNENLKLRKQRKQLPFYFYYKDNTMYVSFV